MNTTRPPDGPDHPVRTASQRLRLLLEEPEACHPLRAEVLRALQVFEESPAALWSRNGAEGLARLESIQGKTIRALYRLLGSMHRGVDSLPIQRELIRYLDELRELEGKEP